MGWRCVGWGGAFGEVALARSMTSSLEGRAGGRDGFLLIKLMLMLWRLEPSAPFELAQHCPGGNWARMCFVSGGLARSPLCPSRASIAAGAMQAADAGGWHLASVLGGERSPQPGLMEGLRSGPLGCGLGHECNRRAGVAGRGDLFTVGTGSCGWAMNSPWDKHWDAQSHG